MLLKSPLQPTALLTLLALQRTPMHAYAIREEVMYLCDKKIWPIPSSTLERYLRTLLRYGYIEECGDTFYLLHARAGIIYQLTKKGWKVLERELLMYLNLIQNAKIEFQRRDRVIKAEITQRTSSTLGELWLPKNIVD